jgi:hypothetical protein
MRVNLCRLTELDPTLITSCGALTATTRDGPGYLSVAAQRSLRAAPGGSLVTDLLEGPPRGRLLTALRYTKRRPEYHAAPSAV